MTFTLMLPALIVVAVGLTLLVGVAVGEIRESVRNRAQPRLADQQAKHDSPQARYMHPARIDTDATAKAAHDAVRKPRAG